ncbi:hypothetical protein M513_13476, partial [Trichuris suis]
SCGVWYVGRWYFVWSFFCFCARSIDCILGRHAYGSLLGGTARMRRDFLNAAFEESVKPWASGCSRLREFCSPLSEVIAESSYALTKHSIVDGALKCGKRCIDGLAKDECIFWLSVGSFISIFSIASLSKHANCKETTKPKASVSWIIMVNLIFVLYESSPPPYYIMNRAMKQLLRYKPLRTESIEPKRWIIRLCPCCNFTDDGDFDERSKLLEGQRSSSTTTHCCPSDVQQSVKVTQSVDASQATDDEQEFLNKVLQQTASEVIDVAALESQTLEPREYVERARHYSAVLSHLNFSPSTKFAVPVSLQPVTSVEASISKPPLSRRSLERLDKLATQMYDTFADMKVEPVDNLVVHFN